MFKKTKLVIIALLPLTSLAAPLADYTFKSPAFNGSGYSSHVLTIENQEYTRQKAWRDQVQAALDKAASDKQNSNLQKFLNNLESRIYAQISQNLAASMFANSGSCSTTSSSAGAPCGSFDFEGNNITWWKTTSSVIMRVTDIAGTPTQVEIPLSQFQFGN
jgi:hypothetical protein